MGKAVTREEFDGLIAATARAIGLFAGVLAEAAGKQKTAYMVCAAADANQKMGGSALDQRLLRDAIRLVLIKARNQHPDDSTLQALCERFLPEQTKH